MIEHYDYLFKTMVQGDDEVGKETSMRNYTKTWFREDYKMTIGAGFLTKSIEVETKDGVKVCKLQIWIMSEQHRFSSIRPMYYRGTSGVFLMFDLANHLTFERLPNWIKEVKENLKIEIPILIVGNKSDLVDQRVVSKDEIEQFIKEYNLESIEVSAKTGTGLDESFRFLARLMIENFNNIRKLLIH
ncbi:MAG: GTP-binding protein [Candidatus Lokiarchaeota archaeon]